MTTFLVGVRKKSRVAHLVAYESKHLEDNRKSGVGLSYQDILGGDKFEPVFQDVNKQECLNFINQYLKPFGWRCFDYSATIKKLYRGKKMYAVIGNWAAGEIREIVAYHTGNPNVCLEHGRDSVLYKSPRKRDWQKYVRYFYKDLKKLYEIYY